MVGVVNYITFLEKFLYFLFLQELTAKDEQ